MWPRFLAERTARIAAVPLLILAAGGVYFGYENYRARTRPEFTPALTPPSPFLYSFNVDGTLNESPSPERSDSPYWWLDSGGQLIIENGIGHTIKGSLPTDARWRVAYSSGNARDTDDGYHPQNLFRLVSRSTWDNVSLSARMRIAGNNFSASSYRNESNALLLMERYVDGTTLYYAGVRVDGTAVIKKKYKGTYYTLAQKKIFPGRYDKTYSPTLIPQNVWLDLRADTETLPDGSVRVDLYLRMPAAGSDTPEQNAPWRHVVSATDSGSFGHTPPITGEARVGIRTDFMDVEFSGIRVESL